jgi:hypothetical protein
METILKIKNMRGQVAIVVLLVSAIMLTMGLSLSKRTTIETKIDTNEELLKKAFNAAESGISYYLGTGQTNYSSPDNISRAEVTVNTLFEGSETLDFGEYIPKGESEFFWLVNHLANGSIGAIYYAGGTANVCGVGFTGALKIDYFYKVGANYGLTRYGYNFSNDVAIQVANFTSAGSDCVSINTNDNPLLIVVTPVIGGGKFYLEGEGGTTFSSQGIEINSTGKAGGTEAEAAATQVNKTVRIIKRYKVPSFMLTAIMSEASILSY